MAPPRLGIVQGTTSACAENTEGYSIIRAICWNYLRVRGEYWEKLGQTSIQNGTTSACAENTGLGIADSLIEGNYLRVRGEYFGLCPGRSLGGELPPRARRIRRPRSRSLQQPGTTSACAENTQSK